VECGSIARSQRPSCHATGSRGQLAASGLRRQHLARLFRSPSRWRAAFTAATATKSKTLTGHCSLVKVLVARPGWRHREELAERTRGIRSAGAAYSRVPRGRCVGLLLVTSQNQFRISQSLKAPERAKERVSCGLSSLSLLHTHYGQPAPNYQYLCAAPGPP